MGNAVVDTLGKPFTQQDVLRLESAFLKGEQVDCPVTHHFGPGVYIREVLMPTGACVIGHDHKHAQFNIMLTGKLTLIHSDGSRTDMTAPQTFVGKPGKKIAYIHEDVRWQNVYATTETDVETLEAWLYEPSDNLAATRLLLSSNRSEDREDYERARAEFGGNCPMDTDGEVIPMPHGSYKMLVSDSPIHGKGIFSSAEIAAHELIAPARIDGRWTSAGRFANHSANANAEFVRGDNGDIFLFAKNDIAGCRGGILGDEITLDYRHAVPIGAF